MTTPHGGPGADPGPERGHGTIVEERVQPSTGEGDHDRFSHYVAKGKLVDAMVNGTPVVALCGKVWVPSRDPQRYPVCPECKEIYDTIPRGGDEDES
jgi:hypothetical protein